MQNLINKIKNEFKVINIENFNQIYYFGLKYLKEKNNYNTNTTTTFRLWLNGELKKDKNVLEIKTRNKLETYLKTTFNEYEYEEKFTRKELAYMLNLLHPYMEKPYGISMTKKRQINHIKGWLIIHNIL